MSETAARKPGTTTYRVEVGADGVLIYTYRVAGICGPANTTERPATLAEVDAWLATIEFERTGEWEMTTAYDGLSLAADVVRVERPVVVITVPEWNASDHEGGVPLTLSSRTVRRPRRRR